MKSEVNHLGVISTVDRLNQNLANQLNSLSNEAHTSTDCWGPARPIILEASAWIVLAALLWVATLVSVS